jgi:hypothetical protein
MKNNNVILIIPNPSGILFYIDFNYETKAEQRLKN